MQDGPSDPDPERWRRVSPPSLPPRAGRWAGWRCLHLPETGGGRGSGNELSAPRQVVGASSLPRSVGTGPPPQHSRHRTPSQAVPSITAVIGSCSRSPVSLSRSLSIFLLLSLPFHISLSLFPFFLLLLALSLIPFFLLLLALSLFFFLSSSFHLFLSLFLCPSLFLFLSLSLPFRLFLSSSFSLSLPFLFFSPSSLDFIILFENREDVLGQFLS